MPTIYGMAFPDNSFVPFCTECKPEHFKVNEEEMTITCRKCNKFIGSFRHVIKEAWDFTLSMKGEYNGKGQDGL